MSFFHAFLLCPLCLLPRLLTKQPHSLWWLRRPRAFTHKWTCILTVLLVHCIGNSAVWMLRPWIPQTKPNLSFAWSLLIDISEIFHTVDTDYIIFFCVCLEYRMNACIYKGPQKTLWVKFHCQFTSTAKYTEPKNHLLSRSSNSVSAMKNCHHLMCLSSF